MDYPFYDPRSQPGFSLYGLPTPDQPHAQPDTFAPLNFPEFNPSFPVDPSFVPPPHSPPESVKHSASSHHTRPTSFDGDETQFPDPNVGSSSEEKESAPAQSKRKAQNRAAYVISQTHVGPDTSTPQILTSIRYTANEHSESARNSMSANSKTK
jgi:hypothetical protein